MATSSIVPQISAFSQSATAPRIIAAQHQQPGVHAFYFRSASGAMYVVQNILHGGQRRWFCSCSDFIYTFGGWCEVAK